MAADHLGQLAHLAARDLHPGVLRADSQPDGDLAQLRRVDPLDG
jgi:hypothetical protein